MRFSVRARACFVLDGQAFCLLAYFQDQRGCFRLLRRCAHSNVAAANADWVWAENKVLPSDEGRRLEVKSLASETEWLFGKLLLGFYKGKNIDIFHRAVASDWTEAEPNRFFTAEISTWLNTHLINVGNFELR